MTNDEYMLILGANVYADPVYTVSSITQADTNTGDKIHLITLESAATV